MPDRQAEPSWRERSGINAEFARFVLVGLVNTGVGMGVIWLALRFVGSQQALALGYLAGIVVAYVLNSRFVFRRQLSIGTALRYPVVYGVQWAFSAIVLYVLVNRLGIDPHWATPVSLLISVPISFLLNRVVLASAMTSRE